MLLASNLVSGRFLTGLWGNYILPAVFWGLLALIIRLRLDQVRLMVKARHRKMFCWAGLICGIATVVAVFAVGFMTGLGRSPYDHSFTGIIINLFYLCSMLAGMELSRSWLMNSLFAKRQVIGIVLTGIIYSLFGFSLRRLVMLKTFQEAAQFVGNTVIPVLSENILASYLASLAGPLPAIIYRGVLAAFHWFSPVLPDLNWIAHAMVSTFVTVFCLVLIYQLHQSEVLRVRKKDSESPMGWVVASVLSVLIVWFAIGVFSIFPTAVVSGSMSPAIEQGDIAIIKRIKPDEVELNDILLFRMEGARIAHRVVDIRKDERGLPMFVTKGDANERIDSEPVLAEQVVGKVIHVIPRAGWITIGWRSTDQFLAGNEH